MIYVRAFIRVDGLLKVQQKEWPDDKWPLPQEWLEMHETGEPRASGGYIWMEILGEKDEVVLFTIPPAEYGD